MIRRPPRSTRTYTLFPYTTLFRSPDHTMLYLGLVMGIPSILLMWMVGLRNPERAWLNKIVAYGRGITLVTALAQFSQTLYHIYLVRGAFSWANGAVMLLLLWLIIYFTKSRSVKDCFRNVPTT